MSDAKQLRRSKDDKMIAGVCAGLGKYFGMEASMMRVLYVLGTVFVAGSGVLLYIVLAFVIPEEESGGSVAKSDSSE